MAGLFKIIETLQESYLCIVFSTSYINPMDQKECIERDLRENGIKGKMLFDLLLSHGNTPDRFFEAFFNGQEINEETLKRLASISENIRRLSLDFYKSQRDLVENSVLTRAQKFLVRKKALR
jgi:hypothetical protein